MFKAADASFIAEAASLLGEVQAALYAGHLQSL